MQIQRERRLTISYDALLDLGRYTIDSETALDFLHEVLRFMKPNLSEMLLDTLGPAQKLLLDKSRSPSSFEHSTNAAKNGSL